jgi:hypothetical protein
MKNAWKLLSYLGLALTVGPSLLMWAGVITDQQNKLLMLIGALLWFATAPLWMKRRKTSEDIFEL